MPTYHQKPKAPAGKQSAPARRTVSPPARHQWLSDETDLDLPVEERGVRDLPGRPSWVGGRLTSWGQ